MRLHLPDEGVRDQGVWQPETLDLSGAALPPLALMNGQDSTIKTPRLLLLWLPAATAAWLLTGWQMPYLGFGSLAGSGPGAEPVMALGVGAIVAGMLAFAGGMMLRRICTAGGRDGEEGGNAAGGAVSRAGRTGAAARATRPCAAPGTLEIFALGFLLAQAVLGIVTGWAGFVMVGPLVGLVPLVLVFLALWRTERENLAAAYERFRARRSSSSAGGRDSWVLRAARVAAMVFLAFVVLAALAPAVESDGIRYHLVAPREWLRAGQFVNLPYNANSNLPAMQGLLVASLTGVMELGRVFQLMQAFNLAALTVIAAGLARQFFAHLPGTQNAAARGEAERLLSAAVPLLVVGVPVAAILGAWPFVDIGSAAFLIAALRVAGPGSLPVSNASPVRWAIVGLLLGGAVAVKLSALPFAAAIGVYALLRLLRTAGAFWNFVLLCVAGLLVLGPWLGKSLLFHGNPVYPVAWGIFGGPEWSEFSQNIYESLAAQRGMGKDPVALLLLPLSLVLHWPAFESHNPGPGWWGFLLPVVAGMAWLLRKRGSEPIAYAPGNFPLAGFAVLLWGLLTWFYTYQSVRFLIPHLVLLTALGAASLAWMCCAHGRLVKDLGWWLLALGIAGGFWAPAYRTVTAPVNQAALGLEAPEDFITRRFNAYPAVQWLNQNTEPGEPVFYIGEFRAAYAETYRPLASDWFDTPLVLVELRAAGSAEALLRSWQESGIRYVLLNQAELSLYEDQAFRPRFTTREWLEFERLRSTLRERIVYDTLGDVYVCRVRESE